MCGRATTRKRLQGGSWALPSVSLSPSASASYLDRSTPTRPPTRAASCRTSGRRPRAFPWSSRRRRAARPGSCGYAATRYELTDPSCLRRRCSTRSTPLELPRRASPCGTFQLRSLWRQTRRRGGAAPTLTLSESAGRVARTAGRTPSASCGCAARIYRSMRGPWRRCASGPNSHA